MNDREKELTGYLCKTEEDKKMIVPTIKEMVFLEGRLDYLKTLPFIKVHPEFPDRQRATPAQKQYKELLQQYTNIIKILEKDRGKKDETGESPLRKWVKGNAG